VALTKVSFIQIFLHFGQFYFYSRQVCNKRWANWTDITDTSTLNGFTRNAKHGFSSLNWSNLAWNSSSSLTIYFSIFPFYSLQLPLREKLSFSLRNLIYDLGSLQERRQGGGGVTPPELDILQELYFLHKEDYLFPHALCLLICRFNANITEW